MTATKKKYWTLLFKPKVLLVIQKLWFMSEENRTKEKPNSSEGMTSSAYL